MINIMMMMTMITTIMIKLMTNLECEQTLLLSSACALVTHELHTFLLLLQKRA